MLTIHNITMKTGNYLARELELDRQKEIKIIYGMELLLTALIKSVIIMTLAFVLGIFRETVVLVLTAGFFRLVSGGEHCQAFYRCLTGGALVFLALGFLTKNLNHEITYQTMLITILTVFPLITAAILKYAPGDTANKPINHEKEKARLRRMSLVVEAICLILVVVFLNTEMLKWLVLPVVVGLGWQTFTITPLGYGFIKGVDYILSFRGLGRRGQ